jgi:hypothetical protein
VKILEVLNYPEVVLSLDHSAESAVELQNVFLKNIRGSNFKDGQATIFSDKNECLWFWKDTRFSTLIHEIIISFLAKELNICVPKSMIGKKGHSLGLIQEWINNAVELSYYKSSQPNVKNKDNILDLIIFMAWIGANDRHGGNYLFSDGKIYAIDFEDSFSTEIHGTELCLYFPWINSSTRIQKSITRIRDCIKERNLIQKVESLNDIINLKEDNRAKEALKRQIFKICMLLRHNYYHLERIVENYIENSASSTNSIDLF